MATTAEQAAEIAEQLKMEGEHYATLTNEELAHSVETYGYGCTAAEVRAALQRIQQ